MPEIHPTGTCFDDALDLIAEIVKAHPDAAYTREFELVHAICHPPEFHKFAHAWVETDQGKGVAIFFGIIDGRREQIATRAEEYRQRLNVLEETRYTPYQAYQMNDKHENYGPWEQRYIDLTRDKGRRQHAG